MTNEEEPVRDAEQTVDAESGDGAQSDRFCPRFEEGGTEHHMLAHPDPSYAPEDVVFEGHVSDGVVGHVAGKVMVETQLVPNSARNHVILCHVLPERRETSLGGWTLSVSCAGLE